MEIKEIKKFGIKESLIQEYVEKAKNGEYIIALLGEFSSGKSTFINAYLDEKDFLPNLNVECTPVLIDIIKGNKEKMILKFYDGSEDEIELNKENIKKYAIYDREKEDKSLVSIHLEVNNSKLEKGYHLVDTPGMNTIHKEHEYITRSIMRKADIVIYMINKELTALDLERLTEIKKYTKEILFVVSHMDEIDEMDGMNEGEWKDREEEEVNSFVELAEKTLVEKGFNSIVLPIGSYSAYKNEKMINKIRNIIHTLLKESTEKEFKNRIQKQLKLVFEMRVKELKEEYDLSKKIIEVQKDECEFNIEKIEKKLSNIEKSMNWNVEKIEKYNKSIEESLEKDIKRIYKSTRLKFEKIIEEEAENLDESRIFKIIEAFEEEINIQFKDIIDSSIKGILNRLYREVNEQIKEVYKDVYVKFDNEIKVPTIEEFDMEMDRDLIKIKEKKEELIYKEAIILDTINEHDSIVQAIQDETIKIEEKINEVEEKEAENLYVPEYTEIEEEGAGNSGAKVGRIVGEVVDMALFVWAPQGKLLKVADKLKDGVKAAQYLGKGIAQVDKFNKACQEKERTGLLKYMDMLSAGGVGEKIGREIGNCIVPYKKIKVENEDKKIEWEKKSEFIKKEKELLIEKEERIRIKIEEEEISRIGAIREREEISRLREKIEEKEIQLRKEKENIIEQINRESIISHYKGELEKICEKEATNTWKKASKVMDIISKKILLQCDEEFEIKVNQLKEKIKLLNDSKERLEKEIGEKEVLIEELNEYPRWVSEWI